MTEAATTYRLGRPLAELAPPPDTPVRLAVPDTADDELHLLASICNRINETAKTITQPSEPLDERWREGWTSLLTELDRLERQLIVVAQTRPRY